ncbi:PAS domain S-box protein [Virgibacillus byunsanensis]|uniref:PAS domain S-box protein n=1 Tax=Virgibacillus byunsanensis TaxID=570945 RepID=A0ABW3LQG0_9BACI
MQQFLDKLGRDLEAIESMFNTIEDLLFIMNFDGNSFRYEYVNLPGLNMLNVGREEVIGSKIEDIMSSKVANNLIANYHQVIQTKERVNFEETIESNNGEFVGETSLNPILTNDGECEYILAIVRDVTERRHNEQELSDTKEQLERKQKRLHSLVSQNDDAVFELDLNGNFKKINDSVTRITAYEEKELLGNSFSILVEGNSEDVKEHFNQVIEGETHQELEVSVYHRDGHVLLLQVRTIPVIIDGILEGVYGIAKDITKEKEMENELNEVKSQLELAWDNTMDAIFLIAQDGSVLTANPTFEKTFGYHEQEIKGIATPPIFPVHEIPGQQPFLDRLHKGETITNRPVQRLTKDGQMLDILASYRPINKDNVLAVAMYRDVTDRNLILKQLEESEKRYRKMIELSPDAIVIHKNRKVIYMNKAGIELLGISDVNKIIGKSIWPFVHPDERGWIDDVAAKLENEVELDSMGFSPIKEKLIHSNGNVIHTEVTAAPIELNGEIAIQAIFRDISERIKQEEQLAFMAFHDPLTGLKNRRSFLDQLEESIKSANNKHEEMAVMYLDMDEFKSVNDEFGHEVGDELLIEFAKRLKENVRDYDTICRIGGDEFLILLENITDQQCVTDIADRVHDASQEPYIIKNNVINVTTSIGISFYPDDGITAKMLIHHADEAMYLGKKEGNRFSVYSPCN